MLDRFIGDARRRWRLLGIVGGGQGGGGDKKKEKALKDRWKNISAGIDKQIILFLLTFQERQNARDQNAMGSKKI